MYRFFFVFFLRKKNSTSNRMLQLWIQASKIASWSLYLVKCIKKYLSLQDLNVTEKKCRLYKIHLQKTVLLQFKNHLLLKQKLLICLTGWLPASSEALDCAKSKTYTCTYICIHTFVYTDTQKIYCYFWWLWSGFCGFNILGWQTHNHIATAGSWEVTLQRLSSTGESYIQSW